MTHSLGLFPIQLGPRRCVRGRAASQGSACVVRRVPVRRACWTTRSAADRSPGPLTAAVRAPQHSAGTGRPGRPTGPSTRGPGPRSRRTGPPTGRSAQQAGPSWRRTGQPNRAERAVGRGAARVNRAADRAADAAAKADTATADGAAGTAPDDAVEPRRRPAARTPERTVAGRPLPARAPLRAGPLVMGCSPTTQPARSRPVQPTRSGSHPSPGAPVATPAALTDVAAAAAAVETSAVGAPPAVPATSAVGGGGDCRADDPGGPGRAHPPPLRTPQRRWASPSFPRAPAPAPLPSDPGPSSPVSAAVPAATEPAVPHRPFRCRPPRRRPAPPDGRPPRAGACPRGNEHGTRCVATRPPTPPDDRPHVPGTAATQALSSGGLPAAGAGNPGTGPASGSGGSGAASRDGVHRGDRTCVRGTVGRPPRRRHRSAAAGATASAAAPPVGSQVARQVAMLRGGPDGTQTMTLVLNPENLGPVEVSVTMTKGTVDLTLRGAHEMGRARCSTGCPTCGGTWRARG